MNFSLLGEIARLTIFHGNGQATSVECESVSFDARHLSPFATPCLTMKTGEKDIYHNWCLVLVRKD